MISFLNSMPKSKAFAISFGASIATTTFFYSWLMSTDIFVEADAVTGAAEERVEGSLALPVQTEDEEPIEPAAVTRSVEATMGNAGTGAGAVATTTMPELPIAGATTKVTGIERRDTSATNPVALRERARGIEAEVPATTVANVASMATAAAMMTAPQATRIRQIEKDTEASTKLGEKGGGSVAAFETTTP